MDKKKASLSVRVGVHLACCVRVSVCVCGVASYDKLQGKERPGKGEGGREGGREGEAECGQASTLCTLSHTHVLSFSDSLSCDRIQRQEIARRWAARQTHIQAGRQVGTPPPWVRQML